MKIAIRFWGHYLMDVSDVGFLERITPVEQKYEDGYHYYLSDTKIEITGIAESSQIHLEEQDTLENLKKKVRELDAAKSKEWSRAYSSEQENKKLKEKIETLEKLCPHPKQEQPIEEEKP